MTERKFVKYDTEGFPSLRKFEEWFEKERNNHDFGGFIANVEMITFEKMDKKNELDIIGFQTKIRDFIGRPNITIEYKSGAINKHKLSLYSDDDFEPFFFPSQYDFFQFISGLNDITEEFSLKHDGRILIRVSIKPKVIPDPVKIVQFIANPFKDDKIIHAMNALFMNDFVLVTNNKVIVPLVSLQMILVKQLVEHNKLNEMFMNSMIKLSDGRNLQVSSVTTDEKELIFIIK